MRPEHANATERRGSPTRELVRATIGVLTVTVGCQGRAPADVPGPAVSASAAASAASPPPVGRVLTREPAYAKFKVTGAKPSEVEGAMQQGWKLVNCSVAIRENASFRGGPSIVTEHCYFEGDEHVGDGDASAAHATKP